MKKSIYIAAFAALTLTACSGEEDRIFDQSAADRLEQYKKDYADVLTSNGGLWQMEYFSNEEEPGYVFVMKFDKNGSVTMSANHKWIGGEFMQETSLWKMIADNGPVLTFNSYNNLFHIFADPSNITGPNAPTGDYGDIDETGFGHEGDYEFQVMEVSDDQNTVRLLGKKRLYTIYLHRLDASTNVEEYLEKTAKASKFTSKYFSYFNLIDADGEPYIVQGIKNGIVSIYPKNGDFVTQTRSGNVIFTPEGMRYMKALEVPRADESADPTTFYEFFFQEDGSLLSPEGARIIGPYPAEVFMAEDLKGDWYVDIENCTGIFAQGIKDLCEGVAAAYPKKVVEYINFSFTEYEGETVPCLNIKITGAKDATYYLEYASRDDSECSYNVIDNNSNAVSIEKKTSALADFAALVASNVTYTFYSDDIMKPETVKMTSKINSNDSMIVGIE